MSRYIEEHRGRFGVEPICRVLGVSASAYYQRATGERSARQLEDERLLKRIREAHEANYCAYGYRRTWKALTRAGEHAPRCQVQRLMRANGIQGAKRRGKPWRTTTSDSDARRRPDLVNRDFTASRPNELWFADFTYLRCWEGLVFFSFVIDVYSRMVVGWQFAGHMRTTLVLDALRMALSTRQRVEEVRLIHHSDRGSQGGFRWSLRRLMGGVAMGRPRGWGSAVAGWLVMRLLGCPTAGRREERVVFWLAVADGASSSEAAVLAGVSGAVGVRWFRVGGGMPTVTLAPAVGALPVVC